MDFARHYIEKVRQWFETVPTELQDSDEGMWTSDEEGNRLTRRRFRDHVVNGTDLGRTITEHSAEWLETMRGEGIWDGVVCEACDLPIEIDFDPSTPNQHQDPKFCRRTRPFCLNLEYKVDWRERAFEAERALQVVADWVERKAHWFGVSLEGRNSLAALIRAGVWKR